MKSGPLVAPAKLNRPARSPLIDAQPSQTEQISKNEQNSRCVFILFMTNSFSLVSMKKVGGYLTSTLCCMTGDNAPISQSSFDRA
jgi:hypothetical protein